MGTNGGSLRHSIHNPDYIAYPAVDKWAFIG
jgi:hypothetical protein